MLSHILAILWKQLKDTIKNKTVLIQFLMFPFITLIMENTITIQDMPEHFFANLFAIMYVGMAPLTSIASIISEEKEKNTLRVLQMSNVKSIEYLIGNAIYILFACMMGSLVIGLAGGYLGYDLFIFMVIMLVGHIISILVGATIGILSKNQMMATSITVPVMMIFSFLPMLSMFNDSIKTISKYIFSEQLYILLNNLEQLHINIETGITLSINFIIILIIFMINYKKVFNYT